MRWHILFTIIPSILLWSIWGEYFLRYKKTFLFVTLGAFLWGLPLDLLNVPLLHVYYFNPVHNLGIRFLGLPLEEYLFFLLIPQETVAMILLLRRRIYGKI